VNYSDTNVENHLLDTHLPCLTPPVPVTTWNMSTKAKVPNYVYFCPVRHDVLQKLREIVNNSEKMHYMDLRSFRVIKFGSN